MKQLLRIESVPISIEMRSKSAQIQMKPQSVGLEFSRDRRGLTIRSQPIKLNVDTFDASTSVFPTPAQSIKEYAEEGQMAAYEATARLMDEGKMLLDIHLNQNTIGEIASQRFNTGMKDFNIKFIPSTGANINWEPGDLSIQYEMDRLNFDWKVNNQEFEFIPGNIEVSIKEYNKVVFEYVGDPIYVPPSANPNYVPIDVKA
ncbi:MAG: DUF6470 family protein [Oscillospiraceae bacterium]